MSVLSLIMMSGGAYTPFYFTVTGSGVNLRTAAIAAGWNQIAKLVATVGSNIGSTSAGTPALTVDGSYHNGVDLVINSGCYLAGAGGAAGLGGTVFFEPENAIWIGNPGSPGGNAGVALSASVPVRVINNGTLAGGGGGGGGGGARNSGGAASSGCDGGRGSGYVTAGPTVNLSGKAGLTASGRSSGGNGAAFGATGSPGASSYGYAGGAGGNPGAAVVGNSNITWVTTGTRIGSIT